MRCSCVFEELKEAGTAEGNHAGGRVMLDKVVIGQGRAFGTG